MSEEEIIKEIEIIKETQDIMQHNLDIYPPKEDIYRLDTKQFKAVICLLDLYYKQQQQIEEYKKDKRDNMSVVYGGRRFGTEGMVVKDYISKDKILKAIGYEENDEEYEKLKQDDKKLLAVLDTMYSEFCRLEDIEDKKVGVAVAFIEEKRDKYWQDKIRKLYKEYRHTGYYEVEAVLKELLGEEDVTKI